MILTDLELYEGYVNREQPDAYYENQLGDVDTQCDGKDFLCESFVVQAPWTALNVPTKWKRQLFAALLGHRCVDWFGQLRL